MGLTAELPGSRGRGWYSHHIDSVTDELSVRGSVLNDGVMNEKQQQICNLLECHNNWS